MSKHILITGGHLTPAIATIKQLLQLKSRVTFVGRKYVNSNQTKSHESVQIKKLGIQFIHFDAPKLHRKPVKNNLYEIPKFIPSIKQARKIIRKTQPDAILTFGGYLALPIVLVSKYHHIPIITHEQTTKTGLANSIISNFATISAYSWPQNISQFPYQNRLAKTKFLTGNPVRPEFISPQKQPAWLANHHNKPLIYITGGNQGARDINHYIYQHVQKLSSVYTIVHQYGHTPPLKSLQAKSYYAKPWYEAAEAAWLMQNSDLVISRSGANTVTELLVTQSRSIQIPLPTSARKEQQINAQLLSQLGLAIILPESSIANLPQLIRDNIKPIKTKLNPAIAHLITLHSQAAQKLAALAHSCAKDELEKNPSHLDRSGSASLPK